jgi:hypothetical protein
MPKSALIRAPPSRMRRLPGRATSRMAVSCRCGRITAGSSSIRAGRATRAAQAVPIADTPRAGPGRADHASSRRGGAVGDMSGHDGTLLGAARNPRRQIGLRVLLSQSLLASFQFDVQWEGLQLVNDAKGQGGITSMTGYATREGAAPGFAWTWEVRSVNARGLDIRLRLPDGLGALEAELRKKIGAVAARGLGECHLAAEPCRMTRRRRRGPGGAECRARCADAGARGGRAARDRPGSTTPADILNLRAMHDTAGRGEMPEAEVFLADADALLDAFAEMRRAEGAALATVLVSRSTGIGALVLAARDCRRRRGP